MWLFVYGILTLMLTLDLAWWAYADRMLRPLRRARLWRTLLAVWSGGLVLLIVWWVSARSFGLTFDRFMPKPVIATLYLWHLIALPVLMVLWLATGVVTMPLRLARWLRRERVEDPGHDVTPAETAAAAADLALEPQTCVSPSRRQFLGAAFAAAPPLLTAGTVGYASLTVDRFRVRELTVASPNLPRDLDGLRVAHVTDIHAGRFTDGRQLARIVEATNNLRADLVLMTGDLINDALADLPNALEAVRRMDARHGVYTCEGNHDLIESPLEFRRVTAAAGVPLLVNDDRVLYVRGVPVQLLGLAWGLGGPARSRANDETLALAVPRLLARRRPDAYSILLAHHPHAFDLAAAADIPLTLAGHTHGGQLMLSDKIGFGPLMYRYWSGLYRKGDNALVVSNGVGNWFPIRTNAPAEIVHLTLRRA